MPSLIFRIMSGIGVASAIYSASILAVLRIPWLEHHAVYMHRLRLIGQRSLDHPEQFGFAHRQVTPFFIRTKDGTKLHAWHVLPIGLYYKHATELLSQAQSPTTEDEFENKLNFKLLREDPEARLVIHTHGSSGALAAYTRPETYRSLSTLAPSKIHVLAFDYRGFGLSSGSPSEDGLCIDAHAVFDWATQVAGIPASRIVLFGQSMGAGVAIALTRDLVLQKVTVAGLIMTGAFPNVRTMLAEYRSFFGLRPYGLLARFPGLMDICTRDMRNKWKNRDALADMVKYGTNYHVEIFHAQDDPIVPWGLSNGFFECAVRAASHGNMSMEDFEKENARRRIDLDEGGWVVEWPTRNGYIRQEVPRYGIHEKIMAHPQIAMAVMRAFQYRDPMFEG
ncbi:Alpha/Beta hydrolase protein [Paraphoma chrysanthemicola]|nr:Alpha/Beta hydrolase protein [Paraphoma chrysanthemicola]